MGLISWTLQSGSEQEDCDNALRLSVQWSGCAVMVLISMMEEDEGTAVTIFCLDKLAE
jgi:hypothetical protein